MGWTGDYGVRPDGILTRRVERTIDCGHGPGVVGEHTYGKSETYRGCGAGPEGGTYGGVDLNKSVTMGWKTVTGRVGVDYYRKLYLTRPSFVFPFVYSFFLSCCKKKFTIDTKVSTKTFYKTFFTIQGKFISTNIFNT